ncbi:unnamed protein product [Ilex paraguariensis]|uniref:Uncharacterized protein n=1 Tax=Ilex paraguariensis TaxID=185542 RepID=A0ABC8RPP2_9AQUA
MNAVDSTRAFVKDVKRVSVKVTFFYSIPAPVLSKTPNPPAVTHSLPYPAATPFPKPNSLVAIGTTVSRCSGRTVLTPWVNDGGASMAFQLIDFCWVGVSTAIDFGWGACKGVEVEADPLRLGGNRRTCGPLRLGGNRMTCG